MTRFDKVLVANRGEIAVRVLRGARNAGYRTVAVFSDADRDSPHLAEADQVVRIGPAPAAQSYLCIDAIIAAARSSGAQAIHPGYGFLSERAEFAQAVQDAGLIFVGPEPASIAAMGNKSAAKQRMLAAGVPCVPGYQGEDQSDEGLAREARRIGFPVMVKAAAGGGGRGMRLVHGEGTLLAAIQSARSEAASAFGSGQLLIEKAVADARHVEIQVFGDRHGNLVHFGERDCSVQRRHQKVVEEASSPAVDDDLRNRMGAAAVAAARAVNYVGAGTVEFLLDADRQFYFLEMNTRLQVEHPVTEMLYEVDLVAWQLQVAQGDFLPLSQARVSMRRAGHAIEVRLCAEDAAAGYLPQTGTVRRWQPPHIKGIRVDSGLREGQVIGPHYDSLLAKIMAFGKDREIARTRLLRALDETVLLGVTSNRDFLRAIVAHPAFASGEFSTAFIPTHFPDGADAAAPDRHELMLAALALYLDDARRLQRASGLPGELLGWRSSHPFPVRVWLGWKQHRFELSVCATDGAGDTSFDVSLGADSIRFEAWLEADDRLGFRSAAMPGGRARYVRDGAELWLDALGRSRQYTDQSLAPVRGAAAGSDGRLLANSDGRIVAIHVQPGDRVGIRQTLVVLESMKMEFQLALPVAGEVESVSVAVGQQVRGKQLLLRVRPSPA